MRAFSDDFLTYILVRVVCGVVDSRGKVLNIVSAHRDPDERHDPNDEVIDAEISHLTTTDILGAELQSSEALVFYIFHQN